MPESVVLQGVTSSMLGSFCPDTYHIFSISSPKLYSAACMMHLPYKCSANSAIACMSSQGSTLLIVLSMSARDTCSTVVADINCATRVATSCELCTITSSFFLITFRLTIDFARPPIPLTTPFPCDVAKYFYDFNPNPNYYPKLTLTLI